MQPLKGARRKVTVANREKRGTTYRRGVLEPPGAQLNDLYLIVRSVQGLKPGAFSSGVCRAYWSI